MSSTTQLAPFRVDRAAAHAKQQLCAIGALGAALDVDGLAGRLRRLVDRHEVLELVGAGKQHLRGLAHQRARRQPQHAFELRVDALEPVVAHEAHADDGVVEDGVALLLGALGLGDVARGHHRHLLAVPVEGGRGDEHEVLGAVVGPGHRMEVAHPAVRGDGPAERHHRLAIAPEAQLDAVAAHDACLVETHELHERGVGQQHAAVAHAHHAHRVGAEPEQAIEHGLRALQLALGHHFGGGVAADAPPAQVAPRGVEHGLAAAGDEQILAAGGDELDHAVAVGPARLHVGHQQLPLRVLDERGAARPGQLHELGHRVQRVHLERRRQVREMAAVVHLPREVAAQAQQPAHALLLLLRPHHGAQQLAPHDPGGEHAGQREHGERQRARLGVQLRHAGGGRDDAAVLGRLQAGDERDVDQGQDHGRGHVDQHAGHRHQQHRAAQHDGVGAQAGMPCVQHEREQGQRERQRGGHAVPAAQPERPRDGAAAEQAEAHQCTRLSQRGERAVAALHQRQHQEQGADGQHQHAERAHRQDGVRIHARARDVQRFFVGPRGRIHWRG
jgi:hypothetical protein